MSMKVAYCGLICETCPIYLATRQASAEEQKRMRTEIARLCREQYGMDITPADVTDCDGCRSESGRLFSGCVKCHIRNCARAKGIESCAQCADYACEQLEAFFIKDPDARKRLDQTRRQDQQ